MKTITEKNSTAISGYLILLIITTFISISIFLFFQEMFVLGGILSLIYLFLTFGFMIIYPNEARVLTLFGVYKGTIKENGFMWANPFLSKKLVSLRAMNLNGVSLKVNDKVGNPIEIAAVIVWQVQDTAKAIFEVDNFSQYVSIQSEAAIRNLAGTYPYDHFDDEMAEITLRGGAELVNHKLESELHDRLERAGIHVIEARISHLSYAPEIAGAMLQRQQATAVVAARKQIVAGAVGMVEKALEHLSSRSIVVLDDERKAAMVSNLLVVLCAEKHVSPVINAGTLHN